MNSINNFVNNHEASVPSIPELAMLQKELDKEQRVKDGLERFLSVTLKQGQRTYNNETLISSNEMLEDCKAQIALLRMEIDRIKMKQAAGNYIDGNVYKFLFIFRYT